MSCLRQIITVFFLLFFTTGLSHAETNSYQSFVSWIMEKNNSTTKKTAISIVKSVLYHSKKNNIDPLLIFSIIKAESNFRPTVVNPIGASGLMQVFPRYHQDKIAGRDILQIETNIEVGVQILQNCLTSNNDNFHKAMRCYSGGAAKRYIDTIQKSHKELKITDIETRFVSELPIVSHNDFDQPRLTSLYVPQSILSDPDYGFTPAY